MAEITAALVKELREKTGAGMLDCKNALSETAGDLEKAVEQLRKKGIASAQKKAGRLASEGLVYIYQAGAEAALVEVNSETDFVAKNEAFQNFVKEIAEHIFKNKPADLPGLFSQTWGATGKTIEEVLREMVAKIGENISIRRFVLLKADPGERLGAYTHMGSKIAAMVKIKGDAARLREEVVKDIAMHVAAAAPRFVREDQIPEPDRAKEREIYLAQLKDSGKPQQVLEKIIEGKLKKFASEVCLEDQIFIKDPTGKTSVAKHLLALDPSAQIMAFARFQVGEGMAKKEEDFAAEVAKQLSR
jgi:elongation factor Ts